DILTADVTASDADLDTLNYSYQWYANGTAISGANASTFDLASSYNGSILSVTVTADDGSVTTDASDSIAVLSNTTPLGMLTLSSNTSMGIFNGSTLTPGVSGSNLTYQWAVNGNIMSSNRSYVVNAVHNDTISLTVGSGGINTTINAT